MGSNEQNHTIEEIGRMVHQHVHSARLLISDESADIRNYRVDFTKIIDGLSKTFMAGEKHVLEGNHHPTICLWRGGRGEKGFGDGAYCGANEWVFASRLAGEAYPLGNGPADDFSPFVFGSWHPGICQFVMCDGAVVPISNDIDLRLLEALAGRNDEIPLPDGFL